MRTLSCSTDINAAPDVTWSVISSLETYEQWNPFMVQASGKLIVGERLTIRMRPGNRSMTFRPQLVEVVPGRTIRWLGRLLIPGVFDGEHELIVEPLEDGRSRFTQRERFSGILVPILSSLMRDTDAGFAAMNAAFKQRVESIASTQPVQ